jgi:hypothetical protein
MDSQGREISCRCILATMPTASGLSSSAQRSDIVSHQGSENLELIVNADKRMSSELIDFRLESFGWTEFADLRIIANSNPTLHPLGSSPQRESE